MSFEIIIVDNGSTDDTKTTLNILEKNNPKQIKLVYLEKNTGTTFPRNIALKRAEGQYLAVVDSDVEVPHEIFEWLICKLKEDSSIGLIAPKLIYPNGSLQKTTDKFPTLFSKFHRLIFLKKIEKAEEKAQKIDIAREVDYAISAFWVFPRRILLEVGYLDENFFYAPEDVDYCLRISNHNYIILYEPSVKAIHYAQEISRGLKLNKATIEHVKGLLYYFLKHGYLFKKPMIRSAKG